MFTTVEKRYEELVNEIWESKEKQTRRTKLESQREAKLLLIEEFAEKELDKENALWLAYIMPANDENCEATTAIINGVKEVSVNLDGQRFRIKVK